MTTQTMNGQVRDFRERCGVKQDELARELGIGRSSYIMFEVHQVPLPRGLTPADAIAAIERIKARRDT